jgi:hypothetical protein
LKNKRDKFPQVRKGVALITMDDMKKINSQQAIRPLTDPELKVFLKFQHAVGKNF